VISTFNVPVIVDKTIGEINVDDYDALAIPGGFGEFGFYEEAYDERFLKLIREFDAKGKIIATVCSGAFPVGKSGVLKNRKATTYHLKNGYWQNKLKEFGVNVVNEPMVVDGNINTKANFTNRIFIYFVIQAADNDMALVINILTKSFDANKCVTCIINKDIRI
jgi:4-methyl-5(b-hydroxyethyl)-thiazole monophosphate biosynthesis